MKKNNTTHVFSRNKGFTILGLGKQDFIKYFFGGNAVISIIVLILITIFLAKEALLFFPDYRTNLNIYRKSGKEFVDFSDGQLLYQKKLKSLTTTVKQYELYHLAGFDAYVPEVFSAMKNEAVARMKPELLSYKIASDRISSKELIWGIWEKGKNPEKKELALQQKKEFTEKLEVATKGLSEKIKTVAYQIEIELLTPEFQKKAFAISNEDDSVHKKMQDALVTYYTDYTGKEIIPEFVKQSSERSTAKRAELGKQALFTNLTNIESALIKSYKPYEAFINEQREKALVISGRADSFQESKSKQKAAEEGIPLATPERRAELEIQLERIVKQDQDYDVIAKELYALLPQQKDIQDTMMGITIPEVTKLPKIDAFENTEARSLLSELLGLSKNYEKFMADQREKMEAWRHDQPISLFGAIGGFFFGDTWVANSSWNNFFGLKPLFGGSLFITLIAVTVATPFAVGGAIYVNRIATPLEQTLIKPLIEFIQAIPSVVLAFLGILVVGQQILSLSYSKWLEWVPGFPASGEQMMLTAGLLLAFMAIPTMFTLAEDAINNVPKSYNEASLALGATKLQTVLKVILPCSLSGVVAAVLLGFGRIIGETMVVLLVAGGTINWPETWTSPVHTMTGIIAQSTGEAATGSIQYRALFLVGLILFCISLILNSMAQKVIKRYGAKN